MSTPARIDELRKKFDENSRRYFAPLANEYRKAGDLPQAIALCREHLPKQPGHMSGHIVYGQALYEAGELSEARTVFESALALDPENLIALRHLGDIAKAGGDASAARRWYERVLDADPRNDDIAAQLATLGAASATPGASMPSLSASPYASPWSTQASNAANGPVSPTPAFGMGALPTPDAAMRAVDFDVVNAEIARYTPLGVDAIQSSQNVESAPREFAPRPAFEPLDLDAMELLGEPPALPASRELIAEPAAEPAVEPPAEPAMEDATAHLTEVEKTISEVPVDAPAYIAEEKVEAAYAAPAHVEAAELEEALVEEALVEEAPVEEAPVDEALVEEALVEEAPVDEATRADMADVEFEEGIFRPEWPADTAAIIASIATPRTVTPLSVAVTPEDAVAFGREPHEIPAEQLDVEPDLPAVTYASAHDSSVAVGSRVHADANEIFDLRSPVLAIPEAFVEHDVGENTSHEDAPVDQLVDEETVMEATAVEPTAFAKSESESESADVEHDSVGAPDPLPGFATETMGELLVAQGFIARAVDVYQELVRRRPYDPVLTSRLAELRERLAADAPPAHNTPAHNTPVHDTPVRNTPRHFTPLRATPIRGTPVRATPFTAASAVDPFAQADDESSSLTSRELFARIAARRVPRRTPPQASPAVSHDAADGLASLFGDSGSFHDDAAARALADAFAPISAEEMATGTGLDLDLGAPGDLHTSSSTDGLESFAVERSGGTAISASTPSTPSTPARNAGFSFDRFFPDPARPHAGGDASPTAAGTSASQASTSEQSAAPGKTTEDLAQFSAWLKGLSGS